MNETYSINKVVNENGIGYRWCVESSHGKRYFPKINSWDCANKLAGSLRLRKTQTNCRSVHETVPGIE